MWKGYVTCLKLGLGNNIKSKRDGFKQQLGEFPPNFSTQLFHPIFPQNVPLNLSTQFVHPIFTSNFSLNFSTQFFNKNFAQNFPTPFFHPIFPQNFQTQFFTETLAPVTEVAGSNTRLSIVRTSCYVFKLVHLLAPLHCIAHVPSNISLFTL